MAPIHAGSVPKKANNASIEIFILMLYFTRISVLTVVVHGGGENVRGAEGDPVAQLPRAVAAAAAHRELRPGASALHGAGDRRPPRAFGRRAALRHGALRAIAGLRRFLIPAASVSHPPRR